VTTLLLDADIIAYKPAAKAQRTFKFPGLEPAVVVDDWAEVVPRVDADMARLQDILHTNKVIVCLSCPTAENWRLDVLPTYKGNRENTVRPVLLADVKAHLESNNPSYRRPRMEADDIMGILSTHPTLVPGKRVIVSEDKDMKTIPGWLFNPAKDTKPHLIEPEEADWWHAYQALCGDSTDGYAGCPGVGPAGAIKALGPIGMNPRSLWEAVVTRFVLRGFTEADALVQARVARICRHTDYDFKRKEVRLWNPPPAATASPASTTSSSSPAVSNGRTASSVRAKPPVRKSSAGPRDAPTTAPSNQKRKASRE